MKLDLMTTAAIGFAAFAAWHALRNRQLVNTAPTGADTAYAMNRANRDDVGSAIYQNTDWILTGLLPAGANFTPNTAGVPRTGAYVPWEG